MPAFKLKSRLFPDSENIIMKKTTIFIFFLLLAVTGSTLQAHTRTSPRKASDILTTAQKVNTYFMNKYPDPDARQKPRPAPRDQTPRKAPRIQPGKFRHRPDQAACLARHASPDIRWCRSGNWACPDRERSPPICDCRPGISFPSFSRFPLDGQCAVRNAERRSDSSELRISSTMPSNSPDTWARGTAKVCP